MTKPLRAIGMMSGTSLDGIDVAMITTDGEAAIEHGPAKTYPYPQSYQDLLRLALIEATSISERRQRPGRLAEIERELTLLHAATLQAFLAEHGVSKSGIDVIGFHGQTVLHRPAQRLTVQLGDGPLLAELTGCDVVYDLRAADVAAGGQGAPLVAIYHQALGASHPERPLAFLNIGGVANVTWVGPGNELIAFDTGPGNALLNDWVITHTGEPFDEDGFYAGRGTVDAGVLAQMMTNSYFSRPVPKSLDRNTFKLAPVTHLSLKDGAATLTAFTTAAVVEAARHFPQAPACWIVCGGGRHNKTMMAMLRAGQKVPVVPSEDFGVDSGSLEAKAWAYLAVRSRRGLPISFPMTTGAPAPMTGGVLARGKH